MRRLLLISALAWGLSSSAQLASVPPSSVGLQLRSNGWGLSSTFPLSRTALGINALQLNIHSVHHSREMKVYSTDLPSPGPFHLGKAKRLIQGNVAASWELRMSEANPQSYGLAFGFETGLALAALRPVYVYFLELDQRDHYIQTLRRYTQEVHEQHEQVHGDAGWSRGFSEMTYTAGIHTAVYTELARDNDLLFQRFRLGYSVDYYPSDLRLILDRQNQWFMAINLSYEIGASTGHGRW